jgi:heme/copper-type cytochrome/quinol oxidase subunit 3
MTTVDGVPEFTVEQPEVSARNFEIAARLGAAAQAFFFVSFFFAFLYLRALDTNGRWNAHHVHPSKGYGIAVLVLVLVSVAATFVGSRSTHRNDERGWRLGIGVALIAAVAAVVIQCVQFATLGFGPGEGSFPSVFVGWTGLFAVNVLAVVYWLWVLFAESLRRDGRSLALIRPSADALGVYWAVLGLVQIAAFILLYVVA